MSRGVAPERNEHVIELPRGGKDAGTSAAGSAGTGPLQRISAVTRRVEGVLVAMAWGAMFLMMMLVTVDVLMRYLFNSPLTWSFDLVSLYLMPVVFFLSLTDTMRHDEHISVDIVYVNLPQIVKNYFDIVIYAVAATVFFMMFYVMGKATIDSFTRGETMAGLIAWPVWLSYAAAPVGMLPVAILCLVRMFSSVSRALSDRRASDPR